jgi:hypothetical protein
MPFGDRYDGNSRHKQGHQGPTVYSGQQPMLQNLPNKLFAAGDSLKISTAAN